MSELVRCDGCGQELSVDHVPRMWEIRQVGTARYIDEVETKHACSPDCVIDVADGLRGPVQQP